MSQGQHTPVALVTGASRGIGRGIALALSDNGFDCVINYVRRADAADDVKREIEARGRRAVTLRADIAVAADRRMLVDETLKAFGRIDLLVNNAGVAPDVRADLLEAGEDSFDRVLNTNLKGPYFLTQLVARQMITQQAGTKARRHEGTERASDNSSCLHTSVPPCLPKIVTISSVSAYAASPNRGDYCVAKAGLSMMTQLYAARLAEHGIGVYEIRPGVIDTDMTEPVRTEYDALISGGLTPIARWGTPDDVARAVVAVATGMLPFSTGEVINVDGGFHMRRL